MNQTLPLRVNQRRGPNRHACLSDTFWGLLFRARSDGRFLGPARPATRARDGCDLVEVMPVGGACFDCSPPPILERAYEEEVSFAMPYIVPCPLLSPTQGPRLSAHPRRADSHPHPCRTLPVHLPATPNPTAIANRKQAGPRSTAARPCVPVPQETARPPARPLSPIEARHAYVTRRRCRRLWRRRRRRWVRRRV